MITIVSGAQTGADRGGLDAAIEMDVPHRGWCPQGRRAEDGVIPAHYNMRECVHPGYSLRTELNVADSDGTVIFVAGVITPGSQQTIEFCRVQRKPYTVIDLSMAQSQEYWTYVVNLAQTMNSLNVAGSRESKAPGIQAAVKSVMMQAIARLM